MNTVACGSEKGIAHTYIYAVTVLIYVIWKMLMTFVSNATSVECAMT